MSKKIFISVLLLSLSTALVAQLKPADKKKSCGCSFSSINQIGLLAGEKNEAFQLQTVNGLQYRTWMVGAGVGIDNYRFRSIPLFLQVRKEFNLKSNVLFIYNDIGLNYPWLKSDQKTFSGEGDFHHGVYYDGGLGYKVPLKRQALVFSGGFSLKEFKENRSNTLLCPFVGPCLEQKDVYSYSLKRLSFKVGIQL
jgi:hypothetical protein